MTNKKIYKDIHIPSLLASGWTKQQIDLEIKKRKKEGKEFRKQVLEKELARRYPDDKPAEKLILEYFDKIKKENQTELLF